MSLNSGLFDTMLAILLPIALGWLLKLGRLFRETEVAALRKFVVRVALPFLIFQNLYHADVESIQQALPIVLAFSLITALYTIAALLISPRVTEGETRRPDLRLCGVRRQLRLPGLGRDRRLFPAPGPLPAPCSSPCSSGRCS